MNNFFVSFIPILKLFKKHIFEFVCISIALICTILSTYYFVNTSKKDLSNQIVEHNPPIVHPQSIMVDIGGSVLMPNIYEVTSGARLKEIVALAGGLSETADHAFFDRNFNLARFVNDQEKIYVPSSMELAHGIILENQRILDYTYPTVNHSLLQNTNSIINEQSDVSDELININTSSIDDLDTLPGIGVATAQKIIQARPYVFLDELVSKKAIKKNIYEQIKELITL